MGAEEEGGWVWVTVLEVLDLDTDALVLSIATSSASPEQHQAPAALKSRECPEHPVLRSSNELDVRELINTVQNSCYDRLTCKTCWEGVWRQFSLDFPRCAVFVNGERYTDARMFWSKLVDGCVTEAMACQLVTLCTQGALADLYMGLRERLVRDSMRHHVVDGSGAYQLHLTVREQRAEIRVEKALQLVEIVDEYDPAPLADIVVALQVQLHPIVMGVESYSVTQLIRSDGE